MTNPNRDPRAQASKSPLPDPAPAEYCDDLNEEFFAKIDEKCDQEELSGGRIIRSFDW